MKKNKNELKKVSVLIPCYNAEKYLDDCLEHLLNQTYANIEVIVVNDGSTDNSENIICDYINKFKKVGNNLILVNQNNGGVASAFNNGLKYVTGYYFMWQDSDDWFEYDAIETMVKYMENNPKRNLARGEINDRSEDNIEVIKNVRCSLDKKEKCIFDDYIYEKDSYGYPGIFITRMNYLDSRIKNRNIYISKTGQNWQLILPLSYNEICGYINKVIYNYRIIDNSLSHSVKKKKDILKRYKEYEKILNNTIDEIDIMPKNEKEKYHKIIRKKYNCRRKDIIVTTIKDFLKKTGLYRFVSYIKNK